MNSRERIALGLGLVALAMALAACGTHPGSAPVEQTPLPPAESTAPSTPAPAPGPGVWPGRQFTVPASGTVCTFGPMLRSDVGVIASNARTTYAVVPGDCAPVPAEEVLVNTDGTLASVGTVEDAPTNNGLGLVRVSDGHPAVNPPGPALAGFDDRYVGETVYIVTGANGHGIHASITGIRPEAPYKIYAHADASLTAGDHGAPVLLDDPVDTLRFRAVGIVTSTIDTDNIEVTPIAGLLAPVGGMKLKGGG